MQSTIRQIESSETWRYRFKVGFQDLADGLSRRTEWAFLAWREIRRNYERSFLGPFWITLNIGILVLALGWFYSEIFKTDIRSYLPFLTLGFVVFGFAQSVITESANVFNNAGASVKQTQLPLSFYVYKMVFRQIIIFAHNFIIFILVVIIFEVPIGLTTLLALPGFALTVLTAFFVSLIIGPVSARFRDIPPIIASVMQIFFFITPIFWNVGNLPQRGIWITANPFYHYLEIVRQPLLGNAPTAFNWAVVLGLTIGSATCAFVLFCRFRSRVAYWT